MHAALVRDRAGASNAAYLDVGTLRRAWRGSSRRAGDDKCTR